jgi:uncharacterized protein YgiM (DUF1202 family)
MKKFVLLLILVCTAFASFGKGVVRTTTTDLNLRVDASSTSRVILTIPQGTQVYLQEDCNCVWVFVTYNGYCGYVNAQFLTKSVPATTTTAVAQEPIRHYTNSYGNTVQSPTRYNKAPAGATALCRDGSYSFSQSRRGTCSHHGGVARWL